MRIIRYYIVNKTTNKAVFTHCKESECKAKLATMENKEDCFIGYKWLSI